MTTERLAVDPEAAWMRHLEQAHALLHAAVRAIEEQAEPNLHLAPAARKLELGVVSLYDAFDARSDRPTAIGLAHSRLWDAAMLCAQGGLPPAVHALCAACGELISAEERLPAMTLLPAEDVRPITASTDLPPLHAIERHSLVPSVRAPAVPPTRPELPTVTIPEPTTFAELAEAAASLRRLAAERAKARADASRPQPSRSASSAAQPPVGPPPGFALVPPRASDDQTFVRRWARECFEEIGMLGVQRAPLAGDDWRECISLERRMLSSLDALAALGPTALSSLEALAMDSPVADPMRVLAITMIGGCFAGRDGLGAAERVLHRFGAGDEQVAGAFVAAMKLVPSPYAPSVLRSLLASRDRSCRLIAVEVLGYRGWLTSEELGELARDDDPAVFALVLPSLAATRHPDLASTLTRARQHREPSAELAALDAMALAAHSQAAVAAREAAVARLGDAALVRLAIVADQDDARWLCARLKAAPSPAAIDAAGWAGSLEAVPTLLGVLEQGGDDAKLAAGAALERLLGAGLTTAVEVEPEALDEPALPDPDPDARPARPALAALVSDPRDLPPAGSKDKLEVPSTDATAWRAAWNERRQRLDSPHRIRRGKPYSPLVSLHELSELPLGVEERRRLQHELGARTGRFTHFDPHDFVAVQQQCLERWRRLCEQSSGTAGSWVRPIRS